MEPSGSGSATLVLTISEQEVSKENRIPAAYFEVLLTVYGNMFSNFII
jgi:hypothetical protein